MNSTPDEKSLGFVLLIAAMPFIAAFHTSLGAPWMISGVSTIAVCTFIIGLSRQAESQGIQGEDPIKEGFEDPSLSSPASQSSGSATDIG